MGRGSRSFDLKIFIPAILLSFLGLMTLLSLSWNLFLQQLIALVIALLLFWFFLKMDFSIYKYINSIIYSICIFLLLISFLGPNVRGATRWLEIAGLRLQPSEFIKPFLILAFSGYLIKFPPLNFKNILRNLGIILLPFFLVFKQPDLGNSLVFFHTWIWILLSAGMPLVFLSFGLIIVIIFMPLSYLFLKDYQKLRLLMFVNPGLDPRGAGYNAIQSMIAVGSGQFWGRGFGRGTQSLLKFLPEYHTDFIFASFSEEFGFFGSLFLIGIFFYLLWQILRYAKNNQYNLPVFLYSVGVFVQLFTQIAINIGMNIGVLPITGITLPLISLGGSSLIATWIGLGILLSSGGRTYP